jgi:hypothetical protein
VVRAGGHLLRRPDETVAQGRPRCANAGGGSAQPARLTTSDGAKARPLVDLSGTRAAIRRQSAAVVDGDLVPAPLARHGLLTQSVV